MTLIDKLLWQAARDITLNDTAWLFIVRTLIGGDSNTPLDPAVLLEETR